ncbi:MAG: flagellar biosynthesis anti-sigma factor FlgM [Clostridia bacterium]|nr:flagellar biosynthesis anti-sigma factor FlgM [Clostridia bacterium]
MKIWGEFSKVFGVYDKQKNVNRVEKTAGVASKKDVVSISNQAKDFQTVMKAIKETPDVRKDKVDELAGKYQSGNYSVDGKDIADRIVKSMVDKRV